ncbi:glycosyltransferase [Diaphorobacter sp.]|uniref:glycosyltransferase n=1 Tax=Diaphorobacter sp. TaxID=1934310 RepID=UPI0025839BF5|nr:glycosyltransferase [Diaphorobacter sp.]
MLQPTRPLPAPYYIHAPHRLDEGFTHTAQLHALCHQLNMAGYPAYLVDALTVHGGWWTPLLTPAAMASHHVAGLTPISIQLQGGADHPRPGLQVRLQPALRHTDGEDLHARLSFDQPGVLPAVTQHFTLKAALPWFDTALLSMPCDDPLRTGALVYSGHLPGPQFQLRPEHAALRDISPFSEQPVGTPERWRLLTQARVLYAYAGGTVATEARLLGCQVVYVSNDHQLQNLPLHPLETWGACLNTPDAPLDERPYDTQTFRDTLGALVRQAPALLARLIDTTQAAAAALPPQRAWSARQLHAVESWLPSSAQSRAARADEMATDRLRRDYEIWKAKATPTEVYSDICAELVASGQVQPPAVHIFGHGRSQSALADAMDELGKSWLPPGRVVIHSDLPAPDGLGDDMQWIGPGDALPGGHEDEWVVLMEAGTQLEPYALIELMAAAHSRADARMVYAAHDVPLAPGQSLPQFTGGANVEWLRGTNYLGGVAAVRAAAWAEIPGRERYSSAYRLALRSSALHGAASVHYVDKVLSHGAAQLAQGQESDEFAAAQAELQLLHPGATLQASDLLGCWRVCYPDGGGAVTLIVPTGKQQGYLRSLLLSCIRCHPGAIREALLVVQGADLPAMEQFTREWQYGDELPLRLIASGGGAYNHARSVNLGLAEATTDLVLVCDDDIEWLDGAALSELRSLFCDDSIAMAAPRLVLQQGNNPLVLSGPHLPGGEGLLNYTGEAQGLAERGYQNRLQMAQDVAGVHGSCWMARRSAILSAGGLDEVHTPLFQPVADLGYRLQEAGWRLVWTPHANAAHMGGMTLKALRRDTAHALALAQAGMDELRHMRERWVGFAGRHPLYSKHLSGHKPYALDTDIVSTWSPDVQTRPRVLALPIRSGSGQYRVIEPLDAVQLRSLAETCVVAPEKAGQGERRILTPLDVARLQPNRIVVQHSTSDQDIANLRAIRQAHPRAFIVQLMDDLTSDLPPSHPGYVYGQREGHTRTLQALELSDRLIVSTQPLADYYAPYCKDIRLVPNALDMRHWDQPRPAAATTGRPRIGWVGAAQHLGDLRLVQRVVQELADEVDWVFMGMCPDELRPYVKEFHGFVSYKDYPAKMATLNLDIAIAPLEDNPFNACKSNLRLLEYGAMGWPVVCSDVYPYRTDAPPVLRVPDDDTAWLAALRRLAGDAALRRSQGDALHGWLNQRYRLEHHADAWFHAIFD